MSVTNVRPPDQERSEGGFSLIEVMIAMIVLVFGIIAVTNLILVASASNMTAKHATGAVTVALETMENLKAIRLDDARMNPGITTTTVERPDGEYAVVQEIVGMGPAGPNGQAISRFIKVSVRLTAGAGRHAPFGARTEASFTTFRTTSD